MRADGTITFDAPVAGVDLHHPRLAPAGVGDGERQRLGTGVDAEHERVVDGLLAPPARLRDALTVQEHHEERVVDTFQPASLITSPPGVNHSMSSTCEPWMARPWKNRRRRSTGGGHGADDHIAEQVLVHVGPVDPEISLSWQ